MPKEYGETFYELKISDISKNLTLLPLSSQDLWHLFLHKAIPKLVNLALAKKAMSTW